VKFIEKNRKGPFLAYLSFYDVHTPLMARDDLRKKYEKKARGLKVAGERWGKERAHKVRLVQDHAVYAAMVEAMDQAVGKVLKALERLKVDDRTIVVFTSDNGGLSTSEGHPTSNLPYRAGKGWLYEGGVRVPWIIRAPGVTKAGSTCAEPVISTDFFPTLLALTGQRPPAKVTTDGVSLVPLLKGEKKERGAIYWHYPHYGNQGGAPGGAVRDGDWKLIEWYEDGRVELFNVAKDPGEKKDLAKAEPERVKAMKAKLAAWRKEVGAVMPKAREAKK
jgi:arylsulfatase A-like enzyme